MSPCTNDSVPVRATYFNLYKWPESDAEFIKAIIVHEKCDGGAGRSSGDATVVDGFSRRQLYLRSYPFSSKKEYTAMKHVGRSRRTGSHGGSKKIAAAILRRLLSCAIDINVLD